MTEFAYPAARTGFAQQNRAYVECGCGHRSYGDHHGAVWSEAATDAWYQHRLHMDESCPERRVPRTESRKLRLQEALAEIGKILERVK